MLKIILIILGILIVVVASVITAGNVVFKQKVKNEVEELFKKSGEIKPEIVTEAGLKALPESVQRCLRFAQIVGKQKIRTVRLRQKGFFRQKPNQKWTPFKAEQYYTTDPPSFIWHGTLKAAPLFSISARDSYFEGKGNMLIKLLSTFTVADAKGKEMDEANLLRYPNEVMWFPTAYLSHNVQWEPINANSAKATMSDKGVTVTAILYFDEKGELTNFVAERFCAVTKAKETWETPIHQYEEIKGIRIPIKGEGVWKLSSGDFSYIRLEVTDIEYNNPSIY